MKNYILMAGALVLMITFCVLVVHFEAAQTRDEMRGTARNVIPKGMHDGNEDSIGSIGDRVTGVDVVGKIQSTGGGVMNGADRVGTSLPNAAETAGNIAGDIVRAVVREPSGSEDTPSAEGGDRSKPGNLAGQIRPTIGNPRQPNTRQSDPDDADADDPESVKPGTNTARSKKAGVRGSDTSKSGSNSSHSEDQADRNGETAHKKANSNGQEPANTYQVSMPPGIAGGILDTSKSGSKSSHSEDQANRNGETAHEKANSDGQEPANTYQVSMPAGIAGGILDQTRNSTQAGGHLGQRPFGLSTEEERQWGQRLHEQLLDEVKVVHDRALAKRIDRITAPLLDARRRRDIEYTLTVIKSEDDNINAFSILGGYIYIHTALIEYVKDDEELQFVLAHEIGHVDIGHCAQQLTYTARATELANPTAGQIVGILHGLIARPYTKDQEFAADAYAFQAVTVAGQTRQQALNFPRRFGEYLKQQGLEKPADNLSKQTVAATASGRIQDHAHTQASMDERIARLEALGVSPRSKK